MKINWKQLLAAIAIPIAVGGLSAYFTRGGFDAFEAVNKPFLSPPSWLFPVAWTILYVLMGVASYIVYAQVTTYNKRRSALTVYGAQLLFNFAWPLIFFVLEEYLFAFVWLLVLWALIFACYKQFSNIDKRAGWLLVPYLVWVGFAGYLNFGVFILN